MLIHILVFLRLGEICFASSYSDSYYIRIRMFRSTYQRFFTHIISIKTFLIPFSDFPLNYVNSGGNFVELIIMDTNFEYDSRRIKRLRLS